MAAGEEGNLPAIDSRAVLRYWIEGLTTPDWEHLADRNNEVRLECAAYKDLYSATVPRPAKDCGDVSANVAIVAVISRRGWSEKKAKALLALSARVVDDALVPPEGWPVFLNSWYFAAKETDVRDDTIALANDIYSTLQDIDLTSWKGYLDSIARAFQSRSVDIRRPKNHAGEEFDVKWRILAQQTVPTANVHIIEAYRRLLNSPDQWPQLFFRLVGQREDDRFEPQPVAGFAHVDKAGEEMEPRRKVFPLDPTQRQALRYALAMDHGQVLVVHGPPGTGKTTFLSGLIASLWVRSLLEGDPEEALPPLIVGASGTNQAMGNILKIFDGVRHISSDGARRIDDRFIPGMTSYGWLLPARSKQQDASGPYLSQMLEYHNCGDDLLALTSRKLGARGRPAVLQEMEREYIAAASRVLDAPFTSVQEVVRHLAEVLRELESRLRQGRRTVELILAPQSEEKEISFLQGRIEGLAKAVGDPPRRSLWTVLKGLAVRAELYWRRRQIRGVRKRLEALRERQYRQMEVCFTPTFPPWWKAVMDKEKLALVRDEALNLLRHRGPSFKRDLEAVWDKFEEVSYLPAMFHIAARIWEGRWLAEQEKDGTADRREDNSKAKRLRVAAMLAPCLAVTTHSLPVWFFNGDGPPRENIDLLLLDEAGETSAAVGAAAFAFAKRAVVLGDERQLPPVGINSVEDVHLLKKHGLDDLSEALRLSSGSVLAMAKSVTLLSRRDPPGVELLYHYRCLPEIIGFCNSSYYGGRLIQMRSNAEESFPWPPMSFVFTDGRYGGQPSVAENKRNVQEAKEIAAWLVEEKARLESFYHHLSLQKIVAVLTPFLNQENELKKQIKLAFGDDVAEGMTIGTVHKLQGAERPIVLFSSVVTEKWRSTWLEENDWLLNVAVSRAKDSFVLFGAEAIVFRPSTCGSLAKLGTYMLRYGTQLYPKKLVIVEAPGKVKRIQAALGRRCLVVATGGHVRELPPFKEAPSSWSEPPWRELSELKSKLLDRLSRWADELRPVIIATDDDREGEAIAWHVLDAIGRRGVRLNTKDVRRMRFSSLAPEALKAAYEAAGPGLDMNRCRAALARDITDYLIGKTYSEKLKAPVGRVKTGLLSAVAQEEDRKRPKRLRVDVKTRDGETLHGYVVGHATSTAKPLDVEEIADLPGLAEVLSGGVITDLGVREILRQAPAFEGPTTADILILAARAGIDPATAMKYLEKLYLVTAPAP